MLLKLHPHGVVDLVVPEGAQGLGLELVAVLHDDFGLMQVVGDLPGGKVDVCKVDTKSEGCRRFLSLRGFSEVDPIQGLRARRASPHAPP